VTNLPPPNIDFDKVVVTGDVRQLTLLVERLKSKKADLSEAEEKVSAIKEEISRIECDEIPDMMDSCSVKELTLGTGEKVVVKQIIKAGLPTKGAIEGQKDADKKAMLTHRLNEGLDWLRKNGGEPLIKNKITIEFSKGQDNLAGDFEGKAEELGLPALREQSVNNSSLSKFVGTKLSAGVDMPKETLGIYLGRKAEVKKAR